MIFRNYHYPIISIFFVFSSISCVTTNVYEKSYERMYENETLKAETITLKKDKNLVSVTKTENMSTEVNGLYAEALIKTTSTDPYENVNIKLYNKGRAYLGEKNFKSKDGKLVFNTNSSSSEVQKLDKSKKYQELVDYGDFAYVEGEKNSQSFFVSKKEVTQLQYKEIMGTNPSKNIGDSFPVEQVSLFDALDFCNRKSLKENKTPCYSMRGTTWYFDKNANGYRLLTGDEFKFTANSGGNSDNSNVSEFAWTKSNSGKHTHEVGRKKANLLGIYDMGGNVWEWCWDNNYTVCGGSVLESPDFAKSYSSKNLSTAKVYSDVGFRIARNVSSQEKSAFLEKKKLSDKLPLYFSNAFKDINKKRREEKNNRSSQQSAADGKDDSGRIRNETFVENVTVNSKTNTNYIVYSFLGKPFVIAGASAWNLLKCAGYGLINFGGGYNTVTNGNFYWKMPDTKAAKEKAAEARANNGIAHYPEYHKPFTDNTMEVYTFKKKTDNDFSLLSDNTVKVYDEQHAHYDNSMSVSMSAKADANSTAAVVGLVGTVITVPVSAITWVGGAAIGIYSNVVGNK